MRAIEQMMLMPGLEPPEVEQQAETGPTKKRRRRKSGGEVLRDEGIARVETNNHEFVVQLRRVARKHSDKHGKVTVDDLRLWADAHQVIPAHRNAYGAIFKGRDWRLVGRQRSTYPSNHYRWISVWLWIGE
jgi:hypothetical protein